MVAQHLKRLHVLQHIAADNQHPPTSNPVGSYMSDPNITLTAQLTVEEGRALGERTIDMRFDVLCVDQMHERFRQVHVRSG